MATCTYTVPDKNASGDNFYGAVICNQAYVDYFWNTYGFSGNKIVLGRRLGLGRLLQHQQAAGTCVQRMLRADLLGPDYLNDSYSSPILNWGRRYVRENIDSLRCFCGDGTAIARSKGGGSWRCTSASSTQRTCRDGPKL